MKVVSVISRYLLGLMFTVFGLNGFLHFIHQPPPTDPLALQFFGAVTASHLAAFFFAIQVLGGLLLLSGYFVPLALTLLGSELYNILAFHLTFEGGSSIAPAWWPVSFGCWFSLLTVNASTGSSAQNLQRGRRTPRFGSAPHLLQERITSWQQLKSKRC